MHALFPLCVLSLMLVLLLLCLDLHSMALSSHMQAITLALGTQIKLRAQHLVTGEFDKYWPRVAVSYGTGHRDGIDGKGCGPGMVYAAVSAAESSLSFQCREEFT